MKLILLQILSLYLNHPVIRLWSFYIEMESQPETICRPPLHHGFLNMAKLNSEYKIQFNSEYKIQFCLPLKIPCLKTAYISGYIFMSSSYLLSGGPSLYHQSTYFITTSQKLNMGKMNSTI